MAVALIAEQQSRLQGVDAESRLPIQLRRTPACQVCGTSGYVSLWSVSAAGLRTWFCSRVSCRNEWASDELGPQPTYGSGV